MRILKTLLATTLLIAAISTAPSTKQKFNPADEHDPLLIWPRPNIKTTGKDPKMRLAINPCFFTFDLAASQQNAYTNQLFADYMGWIFGEKEIRACSANLLGGGKSAKSYWSNQYQVSQFDRASGAPSGSGAHLSGAGALPFGGGALHFGGAGKAPSSGAGAGKKGLVERLVEAQVLQITLGSNSDPVEFPQTSSTDEGYFLNIAFNGSMTLHADHYVGLVHGLETFSQIVFFDNTDGFFIPNLPISIIDTPVLKHRGVMVDTSRHFLTKEALKKVIDGLSFSKNNVLHWHISDAQSFPIFLKSFPDMHTYTTFSPDQFYSLEDIEEIRAHGRLRAVRVVPEIDSPSHTNAIGFYPPFKKIMSCGSYNLTNQGPQEQKRRFNNGLCSNGMIDPTQNGTYDFWEKVVSDFDSYFHDDYFHFGFDELTTSCWVGPQVDAFKKKHGLTSNAQLREYYRTRLRSMLKNKTAIYWIQGVDNSCNYTASDTLQYWGNQDITEVLNKMPNDLIWSSTNVYYLDCGLGNLWGGASWCGGFKTWSTVYNQSVQQFNLNATNKGKIIGGEMAAWGELQNSDSIELNLFPRAIVAAEKWWSQDFDFEGRWVVKRIARHLKRTSSRGVRTGPISTEYCESEMKGNWCF